MTNGALKSGLRGVVCALLLLGVGATGAAWEYRGMAYFLAFRDYDGARVERDLRAIRALGFNWVSLDVAIAQDGPTTSELYLPYARPDQTHSSLPYRFTPERWHHFPSDDEMRHFIRTAHAVGLSVLFKPHVHPFRSGLYVQLPDGSWADPMLPTTVHPRDVDAWFAAYTRILVTFVAALDVDAVCVGNELSGLYGYGDRWRALIQAVRAARDVPVTAAFDWWVVLLSQRPWLNRLIRLLHLEDNLLGALIRQNGQTVRFEKGARRRIAVDVFRESADWADALDLVGVNFYFPLSDAPDPSLDALRRAWHAYRVRLPIGALSLNYVAALRAWSKRTGKPLLFTEGGWSKRDGAARFPANWYGFGRKRNAALQARCYRAFFSEAAPLGVGMFFWDWAEAGYSPEGSPAEAVIREAFQGRP